MNDLTRDTFGETPVETPEQRIHSLECTLAMLTFLYELYLDPPPRNLPEAALNQFLLRTKQAKLLLPDYFPEMQQEDDPIEELPLAPRKRPYRRKQKRKAKEPTAHPLAPVIEYGGNHEEA